MEESVGESPDSDHSGDLVELFPEILAVPDGDESLAAFQFEEGMVEEIMQELWKEISAPPAELPSPAQPGFVVDDSKESCGASFSASASTVMAGVEMGGGGGGACLIGLSGRKVGRAAGGKGAAAAAVAEEECYVPEFEGVGGEKMEGCDGFECDDEWLSRVLSWGPLDLDDWT